MAVTKHQGWFKDQIRFVSIVITLFVSLGSFTYGYCASIIATTLGQPNFYKYLNLAVEGPGLAHTNAITGAMNGLFQGGGLFGSLIVGPLCDRLSRRGGMAVSAAICLVGGALQCGSVNVGMFLFARFLTGLGTGMVLVCVPLYQSEVSPPHTRGLIVGIHGVSLCCGYSVSGWVGFACFSYSGQFQWRFPLAVQCFAPIMLLIGIFFIPESPRWLLLHDQHDKAYKVTEWLHRDPQDPEGILIKEEFYALIKQLEFEKMQGGGGYRQLFSGAANRKRLALGFFTVFGGQCTGTLVINNYGVSLYSSLGYEAPTTLAFAAGWATVAIAGNAITAVLVDRVGRVKFLIIGMTGCMVAIIIEMALLATYKGTDNKAGLAAAVAFLFVHVGFYSSCIDATTYIYCTEIFPNHLRARGTSIAVSGLFFATVIFTCAAPTAFANIGWKYYLVFVVTSFILIVCMWIWWPETKGLSLEEISALFGDEVAVDVSNMTQEQRDELDSKILARGSFLAIEHVEEASEGNEKI